MFYCVICTQTGKKKQWFVGVLCWDHILANNIHIECFCWIHSFMLIKHRSGLCTDTKPTTPLWWQDSKNCVLAPSTRNHYKSQMMFTDTVVAISFSCTSYSSDLTVSCGTKASSSVIALTTSGRESQLSSGPRLLHVEMMSTTCKIMYCVSLSGYIYHTCGEWWLRMCVWETSARHSSRSPCKARAAGVATSGLVHCLRVSVMAANMSPPCW